MSSASSMAANCCSLLALRRCYGTFNPRISITFFVACCLAWRTHKQFLVRRLAPSNVQNVTATLKPLGQQRSRSGCG
jgi:hypothetical protein